MWTAFNVTMRIISSLIGAEVVNCARRSSVQMVTSPPPPACTELIAMSVVGERRLTPSIPGRHARQCGRSRAHSRFHFTATP